MSSKDGHKAKLLEHLGDPEKAFPKRVEYPDILGVSRNTLYYHFSSEELSEIEKEAVEIRKKSCSRQRSNVLEALYKRALGYSCKETKVNVADGVVITTEITKIYPPDRAAAQEFLDRTEGRVLDRKEIGISGKELAPILNVEFTGIKSKTP